MAHDKLARKMLSTATWLNDYGNWKKADSLMLRIIHLVVKENPRGEESQ